MRDEERCLRCGATLPAGGACRRCLLALGLSEGFSAESDPAPSPSGQGEMPGHIGPFRILGTVGSGGSGVVYLAEREHPLPRRVALKVIRAGLDSREVLARFEAERAALALLSHPGMATVFDAGATEDGRPYFVMEWVRGVPITEHCDRERLGQRPRLELFAEVCEAIEHAHAKGLLHRNIRPSNVLVTEEDGGSRPRVTDFGIARALDQRPTEEAVYTGGGLHVGALGYASPEQLDSAGPGVDTRSDVYSLGVLLYELLAGVPPWEPRRLRREGWAEIVRIIREETPPRPSRRVAALDEARAAEAAVRRGTDPRRLARQLEGDLDWITLRALEKDPSRRSPSARALASDVRRCLAGEPVAPGLRARARRLLRVLGAGRRDATP